MSNGCETSPACPGCGRIFMCGMEAGRERCWCADLPPLEMPPVDGKGCYCPECLKKMLAAESVRPA
ncbi:MAG: cysteine-rich CWC family protein [Burkholderiales bacterium]|nr:cysteine-rich CWC family protein [Zoogloeaceae bacterium]MBP9653855.1 cysteine-rich CWC family protein [Rhodocyclaceae bacterium]MCZ2173828.1 cysteine-rich CWC family protein [Burkholderiales bacterium]HNQ57201.1 cysteine-rich CWC family protein [Candidatus Desulfobacillus denitrificans]MCC7269849.1 cysteine-rich CWC family protein [Rhodocyclaceae bacterium]